MAVLVPANSSQSAFTKNWLLIEKMPSNIRVFLDITIGNKAGGRIVFELFNDVAPMAVENFRGLCTGEYGNSKTSKLPLSLKGCKFFRVVPGFVVQSGDFECNNGDGGESIYGGTFKDESFLRRHAQAGVLSMANQGKHTNSSQFFVTLKRAPQLDGKHVAFGQVVQGMEVLRAIEKCPIDSNNMPRVPIQIIHCGELEKQPVVRRTPTTQLRDTIATLMATVTSEEPVPTSTDAQLGAETLKMALKEKTNDGTTIQSVTVKKDVPLEISKRSWESYSSDELETQPKNTVDIKRQKILESEEDPDKVLDLNDDRQKKLYELRLKINQSRKLNAKEVSQEFQSQREVDPKMKYLKSQKQLKETLKDFDRLTKNNEGSSDDASSNDDTNKNKKDRRKYDSTRRYLNETADVIQWKDHRQKKKSLNAEKSFGWNALNTDSHFRAHKKRTRDLKLQNEEYAAQMIKLGDHFYDPTAALVSAEFKPSEEAKERLAQEIEKQGEKRKTFSRRRMYIENENVGYINEFNRTFNQKLERAYGAQAREIRHNLERGTAL